MTLAKMFIGTCKMAFFVIMYSKCQHYSVSVKRDHDMLYIVYVLKYYKKSLF